MGPDVASGCRDSMYWCRGCRIVTGWQLGWSHHRADTEACATQPADVEWASRGPGAGDRWVNPSTEAGPCRSGGKAGSLPPIPEAMDAPAFSGATVLALSYAGSCALTSPIVEEGMRPGQAGDQGTRHDLYRLPQPDLVPHAAPASTGRDCHGVGRRGVWTRGVRATTGPVRHRPQHGRFREAHHPHEVDG